MERHKVRGRIKGGDLRDLINLPFIIEMEPSVCILAMTGVMA